MKRLVLTVLLVSVTLQAAPQILNRKSPDEQRAAIQQEHENIIEKVTEKKPEIKEAMKDAAGYATFSALNVNVLLASTTRGTGYLIDNTTGEGTYMRVRSVGAGVGAGIKDLQALLVFNDHKTLEHFRDKGWQFGAQADASLKSDDKGAAVGESASVGTKGETAVTGGTSEVTGAKPKIEIYRITKAGISAQATIAGTKFSKMDKLNKQD